MQLKQSQGDNINMSERSNPPSTSQLVSKVYENHSEYMQNNFIGSSSQKNVKVSSKHLKKPSAGAILSKGQKQLKQILSNQQQNFS
jgi:hypothetical protein